MDLLYPLIPKLSEYHWTSFDVIKSARPSKIWMYWKYTWKLAKIDFSLKIVETWNFAGFLADYVRKWRFSSTKQVWSIYLVKYLWNEQNKNYGISPTPYYNLWRPPLYTNDIHQFHLIHIKRWVIDVKTITLKHLAQFIGQKTLF